LGYSFLGEHSVKNIAKPVRVYKVPMEPGDVGKRGEGKRLKKVALAAAIVLILGTAAFAVWNFYFRPPQIEPASVEKMAYPLPDKPSIAVLPFDNLSEEPDQDYFADGIAEDILTQLSQIHNLFVIAPDSSFSYKGKKVKIRQVAEELGVRYVLEGSVQKSGDQVRITAQLIDAITGRHLWADRYDRELKDVFAVQDDIAHKVVTELAVTLSEGEGERFMLRGTKNRNAWTLYRKAVAQFRQFKKAANLKARGLLEKAIALDSKYSQAYSLLSWTYAWPVRFGLSSSPAEDLKKAVELTNKASDLDPSNADAQNVMGFIYMVKGQYDQAIIQGKRAVELAPNVGDTYGLLALSQNFAGHYNDAIESTLKLMRLAPFYPPWYLGLLANAYFMSGRYEDSLEARNRYLERNPDAPPRMHVWHAANYVALGQPEKARAEAEQILKKQPTFSLEAFSKGYPFKNRADFDRVLAFAREAGLPDKPPLPLPDKPSIAVLPFVNMSGDPDQEYFSDGITEEIITALSKTPKLFVIARNSTFTYKGKPVKVQQVGRELGVKYVLEGSVRKSGDKVRITAQLVDAQTGRHLWAERYDRDLKDIFAVQDEITLETLKALDIKLIYGEDGRIQGKGTDNLEAYLKMLQARKLTLELNKESNFMARKLVEEVIHLDPQFPMGYHGLALNTAQGVLLGISTSPVASLMKAIELEKKAISLDPSFANSHAHLSNLYAFLREYEKSIAEGELAIKLAPNSADAHAFLVQSLCLVGRPEEALKHIETIFRLNPLGAATWYYQGAAHAYRLTGRYEDGVKMAKQVLSHWPNSYLGHLALTLNYAAWGRDDEARAAAQELIRINPKFSARRYAMTVPYKDPNQTAIIIELMRKAGLPD